MSAKELQTTAQELFDAYEQYKLGSITTRRFTQAEMLAWLKPFVQRRVCQESVLGHSAEGRTISLLKVGGGATQVLLWSQMHGDEPTATMALLDILNFFSTAPDHRVVKTIRERLSLLMIPMLNPDGAERFQRRTAQAIDMNRDALTLRTSEARILKEVQATFKPEFGFNLHDQDPRYTVGVTKNVTAIALLAPALDEAKSDPPSRMQAKHVAATFAETMNVFVAGHVARYDDTFEPRAFGDNVQRWGTSTVLVESGGWPNDRDKMFIRKLNVVGVLTSLYAIATGAFREATLESYEELPFNGKNLYDVIFRNVQLKANGSTSSVVVDIGSNIEEHRDPTNGKIHLMARIVDIGDLSTYGAFVEHDCTGVQVTGDQFQLDSTHSLRKGHENILT